MQRRKHSVLYAAIENVPTGRWQPALNGGGEPWARRDVLLPPLSLEWWTQQQQSSAIRSSTDRSPQQEQISATTDGDHAVAGNHTSSSSSSSCSHPRPASVAHDVLSEEKQFMRQVMATGIESTTPPLLTSKHFLQDRSFYRQAIVQRARRWFRDSGTWNCLRELELTPFRLSCGDTSPRVESSAILTSSLAHPSHSASSSAPGSSPASGSRGRLRWPDHAAFLLAVIGGFMGFGSYMQYIAIYSQLNSFMLLVAFLICRFFISLSLLILGFALGQCLQASAVEAYNRICRRSRGVGVGLIWLSLLTGGFKVAQVAPYLKCLRYAADTPLPWTSSPELTNVCASFSSPESCKHATWRLGERLLPGHPRCYWKDEYCLADPLLSSFHFFQKNIHYTWPISETTGVSNVPDEEALPSVTIPQNIPLRMEWRLWVLGLLLTVTVFGLILRGVTRLPSSCYMVGVIPIWVMFFLLINAVGFPGGVKGLESMIARRGSYSLPMPWPAILWDTVADGVLTSAGAVAYASYNDKRNNIVKDSVIIVIVDTVFTLMGGLIIFALLGHYESTTGHSAISTIRNVDTLSVFDCIFPIGLSLLPAANVFCVLFYASIVLQGVVSALLYIEGVSAAIRDSPVFNGCRKYFVYFAICCFSLLLSTGFYSNKRFTTAFRLVVAWRNLVPLHVLAVVLVNCWIVGCNRQIEAIGICATRAVWLTPVLWATIFLGSLLAGHQSFTLAINLAASVAVFLLLTWLAVALCRDQSTRWLSARRDVTAASGDHLQKGDTPPVVVRPPSTESSIAKVCVSSCSARHTCLLAACGVVNARRYSLYPVWTVFKYEWSPRLWWVTIGNVECYRGFLNLTITTDYHYYQHVDLRNVHRLRRSNWPIPKVWSVVLKFILPLCCIGALISPVTVEFSTTLFQLDGIFVDICVLGFPAVLVILGSFRPGVFDWLLPAYSSQPLTTRPCCSCLGFASCTSLSRCGRRRSKCAPMDSTSGQRNGVVDGEVNKGFCVAHESAADRQEHIHPDSLSEPRQTLLCTRGQSPKWYRFWIFGEFLPPAVTRLDRW